MLPHSDSPSQTRALLPLPVPTDRMQRLVLFSVRRMAAHGIRDAHAANLLFNTFGLHFRRPLVLLRAFLAEFAQCSQRRITIAPCCALRMTHDEAAMVGILASAASNPACASRHLRALAGAPDVAAALSAAAAFNDALADAGQPLVI